MEGKVTIIVSYDGKTLTGGIKTTTGEVGVSPQIMAVIMGAAAGSISQELAHLEKIHVAAGGNLTVIQEAYIAGHKLSTDDDSIVKSKHVWSDVPKGGLNRG